MENIDNSIINSVYPIPASDVIYLRFARTGQTRVEILDITGSLHNSWKPMIPKCLRSIFPICPMEYTSISIQEGKVGLGKFTKNKHPQ